MSAPITFSLLQETTIYVNDPRKPSTRIRTYSIRKTNKKEKQLIQEKGEIHGSGKIREPITGTRSRSH